MNRLNSSDPDYPSGADVPGSADAQAAQRCLLYLFGELDAEAAARFEQALQQDAELRERFADQADGIAALGHAAMPQGVEESVRQPRFLLWPAGYAVVAALAASILCLVWWSREAEQPSSLAAQDRLQTQQLADAWLVSYGTVQQASEPAIDEAAGLEELSEVLVQEWQEPTSPPDWMIAAMAGLDAEQRDGTEVSGG